MLQASERELIDDYRGIVTETAIGVASQGVVYVHPTLLCSWLTTVLGKVLDSLVTRFEVPSEIRIALMIENGDTENSEADDGLADEADDDGDGDPMQV